MKSELEKAYELLERVTPLKSDCGRLCEHSCCVGDNNTGMLLFPNEEKLFEGNDNFSILKSEDEDLILVCTGKCNRKERPLACRMYPLFPMIFEYDGKTEIKIVRDLRGINTCPLVSCEKKLDVHFVRAVRRAAKCLVRDEKQLAHLKKISELLSDIIELNMRLGSEKS